MQNLIETLASSSADVERAFSITWEELWDYFKDYDKTPLGTFLHHHRFTNGAELKCIVAHFPQMFIFQTFCSPVPSRVSCPEYLKLVEETEVWTNKLYDAECKRAKFDIDQARFLYNGDGCTIIFQPRKTR
jgi:hypothetical protein